MIGATTKIKDGLQNKTRGAKEFLEYCENIVKMGTSLAKAGGASTPKPRVTCLSECPGPAQVTCDTGMIAFYYQRDADMLAASKKSCDYNHGKWAQSAPIFLLVT